MSTAHRSQLTSTTRRLLNALIVALIALASLTIIPALRGTPAYAIDDPTTGPIPRVAYPVAINISQVQPSVLQSPDEQISVEATITNTGPSTITDLWVRLQRDARLRDRSGMLAVDQEQPNYGAATGNEIQLDGSLAPNESRVISITVAPTDLSINLDGNYPILINLQGSVDGDPGRVGQAAFTMPRSVAVADAPLTVAWVLPLIDRPHRLADTQIFADDELATLISEGGRLDTILRAAETYAASANPTIVLDPMLIDDLIHMSQGYQVALGNTTVPGTGQEAATEYLQRLKNLADNVPIAITPYADIDVVATTRSGLDSLITLGYTQGRQIVQDALGIDPITNLAWPADGITTTNALAALESSGVNNVLLDGASFGQDDYLDSDDGITESAATELPGLDAIVADPGLSRILTEGPSYAAGPVAAAQRLTAELSMIADQAPSRNRSIVLLPNRYWNPSPTYLERVMAMTTTSPWLNTAQLGNIANASVQDRGVLQYPAAQSSSELPTAALDQLVSPLAQLTELRSAFANGDRFTVLGPLELALLRSASSAWRGNGNQVGVGANTVTTGLDSLRDQIRIVTPNNSTYTLASNTAPLVLTVENLLSVPVSYRIGLDPARSSGLRPDDIGVLTVPAGSRATVRLPTEVERSGSFSVVAQISTPDGKPLGKDVTIKVSSSAYGTVALVVTGVAFAMLLLLIARRWWKRRSFQQHERAEAADRAVAAQVAARDAATVISAGPDILTDDPSVAEEDPLDELRGDQDASSDSGPDSGSEADSDSGSGFNPGSEPGSEPDDHADAAPPGDAAPTRAPSAEPPTAPSPEREAGSDVDEASEAPAHTPHPRSGRRKPDWRDRLPRDDVREL